MRGEPTPAECAALFEAVLVNDVVDPDLTLPHAIDYARDAATLDRYFRLSRGLWRSGWRRADLVAIAAALWRDRTLDDDARLRFKHIRARFKNLRFAHALYDARHRYPPMFDHLTITLGTAQDAFRNRRRTMTRLRALHMRALLAPPVFAAIRAEGARVALTTPAGFLGLVARDHAALSAVVAAGEITGHDFHAARKIVSRHVAFWDTARVLAPAPDTHRTARWLAAINGLMGAEHDRLVERRGRDPASYHEGFALPAGIADRIAAFVDRAAIASGEARA